MTKSKRNKLLLINPFNQAKRDELFDMNSISPPLGLGIIAGLTPEDWDIEMIDENFEEFQYRLIVSPLSQISRC